MDDWEKEDYKAPIPRGIPTDKWEGEDEDEDIKESWEDEDAEKKPDDSQKSKDESAPAVYQRPKKKPLAERLAEKHRAKQAEDEILEQQRKELTPEEKLAEKIKLQKIQEEADLKLAKGLFGVSDSSGAKGIDGMYPETKEQFDEFAEALKNKILFFESSKLYSQFIEKLLNDISVTLPIDDIKRIGVTLNSLYHEKERLRKEQAKTKKKKQKATIRLDKADDMGLADEARAGEYYHDDEDFI